MLKIFKRNVNSKVTEYNLLATESTRMIVRLLDKDRV